MMLYACKYDERTQTSIGFVYI